MNLNENAKTIKEKIINREYNIDKLVTTTDDWYPNYPGDKVKVSMVIYDEDNEIIIKIDVWGMDDIGYELTCIETNSSYGYLMADRVWNLWKVNIYDKVPEGVDKDWFIERGFLWA